MSTPEVNRRQLAIDFEYDERVVNLAAEFAIMMMPHLAPGTKSESTKVLAARMALLAGKRLDKFVEPPEQMICHTCDAKVGPDERARVVVCLPCGLRGGSPGSDG
jgi:hypothetical protein